MSVSGGAYEVPQAGVPRVLVLLAARNGAAVIERQIVSVLAQRDVSVVINVRDDGSSDATREIVAMLAAADTRICLLADNEPSGSASGNFFRLVAAANADTFDLVAFSDQDDEWFPNKLERAVQGLARSQAQGYSAATLARWPNGRERVLSQKTRQRAADYLFEGAGQGCTFVMTTRLFHQFRDAILRHPGAAAALHYHDWAVFALARSLGMDWHIDHEAVMIYQQHDANDTGARSSFSGVVRRLVAIREGWYRGQIHAICHFVLACHPSDVWAARWLGLSERRGLVAACGRLMFIARHGRRRLSDRLVQAAAVMADCL
ncbi:MAG TPA: glycosyltransferase [Ideonella sp.]|uniref:glycosyltransferase n=1 Tax=Ideonella sp. TaxID=1929293 RepID=UPI002BFE6B5E|nr:glycosyltransferase [Ideonella sp.]HSI48434.1 glycosyltransferase [Ideonella sp.]